MLPFLNPRSPNSMFSMYHGILQKFVSALFTTLNWGEGETKFVLSMFNNFVILAGMASQGFSPRLWLGIVYLVIFKDLQLSNLSKISINWNESNHFPIVIIFKYTAYWKITHFVFSLYIFS